jgi:5'-3' exoribonuclease 2
MLNYDAEQVAERFLEQLQAALDELERDEAETLADGLHLGAGQSWQEDYYSTKFGSDTAVAAASASTVVPPKLLEEYVTGLRWVLRYYYSGLASWTWFFPFHYAPLACDLGPFLERHYKPGPWEEGEPLAPLEQLMGVFPAASAHCLPAACRALMSEPSSPIADFYPPKFRLDPNGQRRKWQWVALLPFINEARLKAAVATVVPREPGDSILEPVHID